MSGGDDARMWRARLLWRWRGGALQWPLFVALTLVDAVVVHLLPPSGRHTGWFGALLLAMLGNLAAVVLGRLAGFAVAARRRGMPRVVAEDRAGSVLLVVASVAFVVAGVVHAPARDRADRAVAAPRAAVRAYVLAHGAAVYRANLDRMDTAEPADGFFRTCVPGDAQAGLPPLCLLVRTDRDPPLVVVDRDRTPNRRD
jgi:hypothetical protein